MLIKTWRLEHSWWRVEPPAQRVSVTEIASAPSSDTIPSAKLESQSLSCALSGLTRRVRPVFSEPAQRSGPLFSESARDAMMNLDGVYVALPRDEQHSSVAQWQSIRLLTGGL